MMNFDPDGFRFGKSPPGSIVSWALGRFADRPNYKTKPTSRAKWQTRIPSSPGALDGTGPTGNLAVRSPASPDQHAQTRHEARARAAGAHARERQRTPRGD
jgi:hypothetical protein